MTPFILLLNLWSFVTITFIYNHLRLSLLFVTIYENHLRLSLLFVIICDHHFYLWSFVTIIFICNYLWESFLFVIICNHLWAIMSLDFRIQIQIFLILPLMQHQILTLFFFNLILNIILNLMNLTLVQCLWI